MLKTTLKKAIETYKAIFKEALELIISELNQGQRKKLLKNEKIKKIFDVFGVEY